MIAEARERQRPTPPPRLRQWLVLSWFVVFLCCFAGAVFLGISYAGRPLVPGASKLIVPAGGLLLIAAVLQLSGHAHLEGKTQGATRTGLIYLEASLAMIGLGMWTITHELVWRFLCLPGIAWIFLGFGRILTQRPARSAFFQNARRRGGGGWMWQCYAGAWIIFLVAPVGIAWSIGVITVK
jgi:hypothetical protein